MKKLMSIHPIEKEPQANRSRHAGPTKHQKLLVADRIELNFQIRQSWTGTRTGCPTAACRSAFDMCRFLYRVDSERKGIYCWIYAPVYCQSKHSSSGSHSTWTQKQLVLSKECGEWSDKLAKLFQPIFKSGGLCGPWRSRSNVASSCTATRASPLPRVEIVIVNGLKSQAASDMLIRRSAAPSFLSSTEISLRPCAR